MSSYTRMKRIFLQGLLWLYLVGFGFMALSLESGFLDFDNLPDTNFTCVGKVIGGYYADLETNCQMFHVCTIGQLDEPMDIRFLCLNGTVFDQETRVCERIDEVDCAKSEQFYSLNLELYGNTQPAISEDSSDAQETEQPLIIKSTTAPPTTTTTTKRPTVKPTAAPAYYTTASAPQATTADRQIVTQHFPPVVNPNSASDIRFNPEEINISLNPGAPPDIRTKPVAYHSQTYSDSNSKSNVIVTTHSSAYEDSRKILNQEPTTQNPKSRIQHPTTPGDINFDFTFPKQIQEFRTEVPGQYHFPASGFHHSQTFPARISHQFQSTTHKTNYQNKGPSTVRNVYLHTIKPVQIQQQQHYYQQRTEKPPQRLQLPLPLLPTLPPLTFSSPAPFSLQRHIETKRYTKDHQAPPRIIISASASVSDATGRRLNYSLGTIGAAEILETPPSAYEEYKDEDVGLDPFYHDVPKLKQRSKRSTMDKINPFEVIRNEDEALDVLKFLFHWYKSHQATATSSPITIPVSPELITKINDEFAPAGEGTTESMKTIKENNSIYNETKLDNSELKKNATGNVFVNVDDYVNDNYEPQTYTDKKENSKSFERGKSSHLISTSTTSEVPILKHDEEKSNEPVFYTQINVLTEVHHAADDSSSTPKTRKSGRKRGRLKSTTKKPNTDIDLNFKGLDTTQRTAGSEEVFSLATTTTESTEQKSKSRRGKLKYFDIEKVDELKSVSVPVRRSGRIKSDIEFGRGASLNSYVIDADRIDNKHKRISGINDLLLDNIAAEVTTLKSSQLPPTSNSAKEHHSIANIDLSTTESSLVNTDKYLNKKKAEQNVTKAEVEISVLHDNNGIPETSTTEIPTTLTTESKKNIETTEGRTVLKELLDSAKKAVTEYGKMIKEKHNVNFANIPHDVNNTTSNVTESYEKRLNNNQINKTNEENDEILNLAENNSSVEFSTRKNVLKEQITEPSHEAYTDAKESDERKIATVITRDFVQSKSSLRHSTLPATEISEFYFNFKPTATSATSTTKKQIEDDHSTIAPIPKKVTTESRNIEKSSLETSSEHLTEYYEKTEVVPQIKKHDEQTTFAPEILGKKYGKEFIDTLSSSEMPPIVAKEDRGLEQTPDVDPKYDHQIETQYEKNFTESNVLQSVIPVDGKENEQLDIIRTNHESKVEHLPYDPQDKTSITDTLNEFSSQIIRSTIPTVKEDEKSTHDISETDPRSKNESSIHLPKITEDKIIDIPNESLRPTTQSVISVVEEEDRKLVKVPDIVDMKYEDKISIGKVTKTSDIISSTAVTSLEQNSRSSRRRSSSRNSSRNYIENNENHQNSTSEHKSKRRRKNRPRSRNRVREENRNSRHEAIPKVSETTEALPSSPFITSTHIADNLWSQDRHTNFKTEVTDYPQQFNPYNIVADMVSSTTAPEISSVSHNDILEVTTTPETIKKLTKEPELIEESYHSPTTSLHYDYLTTTPFADVMPIYYRRRNFAEPSSSTPRSAVLKSIEEGTTEKSNDIQTEPLSELTEPATTSSEPREHIFIRPEDKIKLLNNLAYINQKLSEITPAVIDTTQTTPVTNLQMDIIDTTREPVTKSVTFSSAIPSIVTESTLQEIEKHSTESYKVEAFTSASLDTNLRETLQKAEEKSSTIFNLRRSEPFTSAPLNTQSADINFKLSEEKVNNLENNNILTTTSKETLVPETTLVTGTTIAVTTIPISNRKTYGTKIALSRYNEKSEPIIATESYLMIIEPDTTRTSIPDYNTKPEATTVIENHTNPTEKTEESIIKMANPTTSSTTTDTGPSPSPSTITVENYSKYKENTDPITTTQHYQKSTENNQTDGVTISLPNYSETAEPVVTNHSKSRENIEINSTEVTAPSYSQQFDAITRADHTKSPENVEVKLATVTASSDDEQSKLVTTTENNSKATENIETDGTKVVVSEKLEAITTTESTFSLEHNIEKYNVPKIAESTFTGFETTPQSLLDTSTFVPKLENLEKFIQEVEATTGSIANRKTTPSLETTTVKLPKETLPSSVAVSSSTVSQNEYFGTINPTTSSSEESGLENTSENTVTTSTSRTSRRRTRPTRRRQNYDRHTDTATPRQRVRQDRKRGHAESLDKRVDNNVYKERNTDAPLYRNANPTLSETRRETLSTTPISKIKNEKNRKLFFNCFGKEINKFYPDPRDCRLFHYCTRGYSKNQLLDMKFVCDLKTYFDDEKLVCTKDMPKRCL